MAIMYLVAVMCTLSACGGTSAGDESAKITTQDVSKYTNLTFSVADQEAKTMTVKASNTSVANINIPEKVLYNGVEYVVTEIELNAFAECASLTVVAVPKSVTKIGDNAFDDCVSLTAINVDSNNTTYTSVDGVLFDKDKTNLMLYPAGKTDTTYTILSSVTTIDSNAFESFANMTAINVELGNSMYSSVDGILFNKNKTTLISYPAGKTDNEYTIPESVTTISDNAFNGVANLKTLTMSSSVSSVGNSAFNCPQLEALSITKADYLTYFANCTNIKNLSVDAGTIPANAFKNSNKLTTVVLGDDVTSVGNNAFDSCSALQSVTIGEKLTSLGERAFANCSALKTLSISSDPTLDSSVFINCTGIENLSLYNAGTYSYFTGCPNIKTLSFVSGEIGESAFKDNTKLTAITLGSKMTTIGISAFSGCTSLSSVEIEEGLTTIGAKAFENCSAIKTLSIPKSVTTIATNSFNGCSDVENLTIGDGKFVSYYFLDSKDVKTITVLSGKLNNSDFFRYKKVTTINIGKDVTEIEDAAFTAQQSAVLTTINVDSENAKYMSVDGVVFTKDQTKLIGYPIGKTATSYTIPSGVTTIGLCAFYNSQILVSVNIPNTVTSIEDNAFYNCGALASVVIPSSVKSINENAFAGCSALTSATFNNGLENIEEKAFYGCKLTEVTLPDSLTIIGESAFEGCKFTEITIPKNLSSIGVGAFACSTLATINADSDNATYTSNYGILFSKDMRTIALYPSGATSTSYTIPSGTTIVGTGAFYKCTSLTEIVVANSVTNINDYAFCGCSALKSMSIPNNVKKIGICALRYCSALETVTIGKNVTEMGKFALDGCESLKTVVIPANLVKIGQGAFSGCSSLTSVTFENTKNWNHTNSSNYTNGKYLDVTTPANNATKFTSSTWYMEYMYRED